MVRGASFGERLGRLTFNGAVVVALGLVLTPIVLVIWLSFFSNEILSLPPEGYSLRWYRAFMHNPSYLDGLAVSIRLALLAALISTIAGAGAAIALAESRWRGRDVVETLFLSPKFVPTVVIGFSILGFASAIHIFDPFTRLVMGHVVITIPFTVRATLASLVGIPRSLGEAAVSLGAPPWRAFLDITLPLARTGIIAGALMAFVLSFDEVAVSIFLTDAFTQTLPIALVAEMRANLNLTVAAIATVLATLAAITVVVLDRAAGLDNVIGRGMYRG